MVLLYLIYLSTASPVGDSHCWHHQCHHLPSSPGHTGSLLKDNKNMLQKTNHNSCVTNVAGSFRFFAFTCHLMCQVNFKRHVQKLHSHCLRYIVSTHPSMDFLQRHFSTWLRTSAQWSAPVSFEGEGWLLDDSSHKCEYVYYAHVFAYSFPGLMMGCHRSNCIRHLQKVKQETIESSTPCILHLRLSLHPSRTLLRCSREWDRGNRLDFRFLFATPSWVDQQQRQPRSVTR